MINTDLEFILPKPRYNPSDTVYLFLDKIHFLSPEERKVIIDALKVLSAPQFIIKEREESE